MDYFFWDEILGRPSVMGEPWEEDAADVPLLHPEAIAVIITVREPSPPPAPYRR